MAGHQLTQAFLGLGGNLGDPAKVMAEALDLLDRRDDLTVVQVSSLYLTPPWGKLDQPDFLNAVAEIRTSLQPLDLLKACLATELALKRERRERWGPRAIDIDLLLYGNGQIRNEHLEIPHPRMMQRAFVLVPLLELAPALEIAGRKFAQCLADVDSSGIEKISTGGNWWRSQE